MDGSHTHGPSGGLGFADNVASAAGIAAGVIGGSLLLMWVLHILLIVSVIVGLTTMAAATGYVTVRLRARKRKAMISQSLPGLLGRSPAQGLEQPGGVHLHLPPGTSADEIAVLAAYLETARRQQIPGQGYRPNWP